MGSYIYIEKRIEKVLCPSGISVVIWDRDVLEGIKIFLERTTKVFISI